MERYKEGTERLRDIERGKREGDRRDKLEVEEGGREIGGRNVEGRGIGKKGEREGGGAKGLNKDIIRINILASHIFLNIFNINYSQN